MCAPMGTAITTMQRDKTRFMRGADLRDLVVGKSSTRKTARLQHLSAIAVIAKAAFTGCLPPATVIELRADG